MRFARPLVLAACLLLAGGAGAQDNFPNTTDSDAFLPNSPYKEQCMPDAGDFNPVGVPGDACLRPSPAAAVVDAGDDCCCCGCQTTAAYAPSVVVEPRRVHRRRAYALQPAPTLPCAPGYCPLRVARRDRN